MRIDKKNLPVHIAIIMDGNGRWAQKQGMMRLFGHQAGVKTVKKIVEAARETGISVLTLYAFSTENWKRPADEVSGLMSLLKSYLQNELDSMLKNNVRLSSIGQLENLPAEVQKVLKKSIAETAGNNGLILNLALSYGGRIEVISAARQLAELCLEGKISPPILMKNFSKANFTQQTCRILISLSEPAGKRGSAIFFSGRPHMRKYILPIRPGLISPEMICLPPLTAFNKDRDVLAVPANR